VRLTEFWSPITIGLLVIGFILLGSWRRDGFGPRTDAVGAWR
jgi:hypothetical protein